MVKLRFPEYRWWINKSHLFFFVKGFQKNHLMVIFSQNILSRLKSKAPKVFRAFWGGFPYHHHHLGNVNESPRWLSIESWLVNKGSLFHGFLLIAKKKLGSIPSRELTYPTLLKGKSSSNAILGGYFSSLEGNAVSSVFETINQGGFWSVLIW